MGRDHTLQYAVFPAFPPVLQAKRRGARTWAVSAACWLGLGPPSASEGMDAIGGGGETEGLGLALGHALAAAGPPRARAR